MLFSMFVRPINLQISKDDGDNYPSNLTRKHYKNPG